MASTFSFGNMPFQEYLPKTEGLLPLWLMFISVVSIGNSVQCYVSLAGSRQVYSVPSDTTQTGPGGQGMPTKSPVNALSARTFGTWTALSSVIRLYAAYHINDPTVYDIALWSYGIAFAHFVSEWVVFGTVKFGRGLMGPLIVSTATMYWMISQRGHYTSIAGLS